MERNVYSCSRKTCRSCELTDHKSIRTIKLIQALAELQPLADESQRLVRVLAQGEGQKSTMVNAPGIIVWVCFRCEKAEVTAEGLWVSYGSGNDTDLC